jgi:hypothetical protein
MRCNFSQPLSGGSRLHEAQKKSPDAPTNGRVFARQRVAAKRSSESLKRKQREQQDEEDVSPRLFAVDAMKA